VRALLAVLRARSALRVLRSAGVPAALEREREWVPRVAHRWQPTTHSARCAAAAAERRTTSALKYSLFTYASSSWHSRHRVDRVAGARRGAASQPWERIRPHPSAGSMAGMGTGRHGTSTRLLAEWLQSSWLRYDRCEADVRHTAAVGSGLASARGQYRPAHRGDRSSAGAE
jgi:hypothetical protein